MPTSVPAVQRAAKILRHLARSNGRLRLSQIASDLDIHKATCSSILAELASTGLVCREESTKSFGLGAQLLRLGSSLTESFPGVRDARHEMFRLVSELDIGCFIAAPLGDELVVLDSMLGREPSDLAVPIGWSMPLKPPFGTVFYAWSTDQAIDQWLDGADRGEVDSYRRAIAAVRIRGYSVGGRIEMETQIDSELQRLSQSQQREDQLAAAIRLVDLLSTERSVDAAPEGSDDSRRYLIAPIFDRTPTVVMSMVLFGRHTEFTEERFATDLRELLESTRRVTAAIGGIMPTGLPGASELIRL